MYASNSLRGQGPLSCTSILLLLFLSVVFLVSSHSGGLLVLTGAKAALEGTPGGCVCDKARRLWAGSDVSHLQAWLVMGWPRLLSIS